MYKYGSDREKSATMGWGCDRVERDSDGVGEISDSSLMLMVADPVGPLQEIVLGDILKGLIVSKGVTTNNVKRSQK